jgi:O-antigen/teichoic acid export membrane protein
LSNVATIPLFLLMEMILPRALGPAAYGNVSFATGFFQNIVNFLDMGTSTCLQTTLAKRPGEFGLVSFYARLALIVLAICLAAGIVIRMPGIGGWIMPAVPLWLAVPAALWACLSWAGRVARGVNDALGITARSEMVRIGVNLLSALALLGLFLGGVLGTETFFGHQYVFLALAVAGFFWTLRGNWPVREWKMSSARTREYAGEFWRYSGPLFAVSLCSLAALTGERWLLQLFEGSVEQGYFSLGQKVGMACFLFVTAMIPLLMRELAMAHGNNDPEEMGRILDRFAPMLYGVAAWFSCFMVVEASAVVRLFGGVEFAGAMAAVQIMAFYPVHQGYGQLVSAAYYAAGETRALRNITLISLTGGFVCAWVLLAPESRGGWGLGAAGLAVKMTVVQVATVNLLLFVCRRVIPFDLRRNLIHQIFCPLCLFGLVFAARSVSGGFGGEDSLGRLCLSAVCYGILTLGAVWICPFILGLRREEILSWVRRFRRLGSRR